MTSFDDLTSLSHAPTMWGASGGLKDQFIFSVVAKSVNVKCAAKLRALWRVMHVSCVNNNSQLVRAKSEIPYFSY